MVEPSHVALNAVVQAVAAVERPGLVRALEPAVAEAAQEHALADAQDRQVDLAVAVDVDADRRRSRR